MTLGDDTVGFCGFLWGLRGLGFLTAGPTSGAGWLPRTPHRVRPCARRGDKLWTSQWSQIMGDSEAELAQGLTFVSSGETRQTGRREAQEGIGGPP